MPELQLHVRDSLAFLRERATLFRRLLAASATLNVVLAGAMTVLAQRPALQPYVIATDSWGVVRTLEPLEALDAADERVIRAQLRHVVQLLRSWTADTTFLTWLHEDAALFLAADVRDYVEATLPTPRIGDLQRDVSIIAILRQGPRVYTVSWEETLYRRGRAPEVSEWSAVLTLGEPRPTTETTYLQNPLGLQITHLDWSLRATSEGEP